MLLSTYGYSTTQQLQQHNSSSNNTTPTFIKGFKNESCTWKRDETGVVKERKKEKKRTQQ